VTATSTPLKASPTPTRTPTAGSPTVTGTPTPTLPPVPGASATAEAIYSRYMSALGQGTSANTSNAACQYGCPRLSEGDFLTLAIEPRLRQNLVTDKLAATQVMTKVEEIRVQR